MASEGTGTDAGRSGDAKEHEMNILEVVEASGAGVGRHVSSLCRGLVAQGGHRVAVAYAPQRLDGAFRRFVEEYEREILFFPMGVERKVSPVSDLREVVRLVRFMRSHGPFDVVHGHSSKGGAIARLAGRLASVPTVYTPHSLIMSSPRISRRARAVYALIERALGRLATSKFIAVSEDERDFVAGLKLVPGERLVVIENAIDDADFEFVPAGISQEEDVRRRPLTFGSTMRFDVQKAPVVLVEAFVRLSRALPRVPMRLVVIGDGDLLPETRRRAEESGLGERISLPGWRTSVGESLREFDVFVVSSFYEAGLSYSTMEAMAAELPIVSTDVFGTKGTISAVPGNVLVPAGDPDALADGMRRMATLAEPPSLRHELRRIGRANRDYVQAHFRQSEITHRTVELYRSLLRSTRTA